MLRSNEHPHCGEIWLCYLNSEGSVQGGHRPVFILSNDKNNTYSTTINVVPITTKMNKRKLPVHVELWDHQAYGLRAPSTMLIEQIQTVNIERLDKCIGSISDAAVLSAITEAMIVQFPVLVRS